MSFRRLACLTENHGFPKKHTSTHGHLDRRVRVSLYCPTCHSCFLHFSFSSSLFFFFLYLFIHFNSIHCQCYYSHFTPRDTKVRVTFVDMSSMLYPVPCSRFQATSVALLHRPSVTSMTEATIYSSCVSLCTCKNVSL